MGSKYDKTRNLRSFGVERTDDGRYVPVEFKIMASNGKIGSVPIGPPTTEPLAEAESRRRAIEAGDAAEIAKIMVAPNGKKLVNTYRQRQALARAAMENDE